MEQLSESKSFGGRQLRVCHRSQVLACDMNFSIYLPSHAQSHRVPVLYWLSGLTCTDENFFAKAGVQQYASEYGIAIVAPDTSPRGEGIPDDQDAAYDFGLGAGFYVNATCEPWSQNYRMYDYVVDELPALVNEEFPVEGSRAGIFGHSMGGHGALTIALKNTDRYRSVSAFAPICSPMNCPWGTKALSQYLGENRDDWLNYDATALLATATERLPILVDQGGADDFLEEQLKTELLVAASQQADYPMEIRMQPGYDHSYFFIASFLADHMRFHREHL